MKLSIPCPGEGVSLTVPAFQGHLIMDLECFWISSPSSVPVFQFRLWCLLTWEQRHCSVPCPRLWDGHKHSTCYSVAGDSGQWTQWTQVLTHGECAAEASFVSIFKNVLFSSLLFPVWLGQPGLLSVLLLTLQGWPYMSSFNVLKALASSEQDRVGTS